METARSSMSLFAWRQGVSSPLRLRLPRTPYDRAPDSCRLGRQWHRSTLLPLSLVDPGGGAIPRTLVVVQRWAPSKGLQAWVAGTCPPVYGAVPPCTAVGWMAAWMRVLLVTSNLIIWSRTPSPTWHQLVRHIPPPPVPAVPSPPSHYITANQTPHPIRRVYPPLVWCSLSNGTSLMQTLRAHRATQNAATAHTEKVRR